MSIQIAIYEKLRRRRNRLNLNEKEPGQVLNDAGPSGQLSQADAKTKMLDDWAAGIRRPDAFRDNIVLTRLLRKEEAKKLPGLQLMRQYPALGIPELVSRV